MSRLTATAAVNVYSTQTATMMRCSCTTTWSKTTWKWHSSMDQNLMPRLTITWHFPYTVLLIS